MNAYLIVFASAFGAATILPFYSEVVVLAYQQQGYPAGPLWLAATSGNTLGAVLNWWIGRELTRFQGRRWFPVSAAALTGNQRRPWKRVSSRPIHQFSTAPSVLPLVAASHSGPAG